jgi:hypothetical protein
MGLLPRLLFIFFVVYPLSGGADLSFVYEAPYGYSIQKSIDERGLYYYQFQWRRKDVAIGRKSKGAEIRLVDGISNPYDIWVGFRLEINKTGFYGDSKPTIIAQLHGKPDFDLGETWRNPVAALFIKNNHVFYSYRSSDESVTLGRPGAWVFTHERIIDLGLIDYEKLNIFMLRQIVNIRERKGDVFIRFNDKVVNLKGEKIGYNDVLLPKFKFGIYCPIGSDREEKIVKISRLRITSAQESTRKSMSAFLE